MTNEEREALIAQGRTPPVAVDPDVAEMQELVAAHGHQPIKEAMVLAAIKRGRELERQEQTK